MRSISKILEETFDQAKSYFKDQVTYVKLESAEKLAKLASALITYGILTVFGAFFLLFLSLSAGFYLADALDSAGLAFLIICGVYLVLGIIVFTFRKELITHPILEKIIKDMFDEQPGDEIVEENE